MREKVLAITRFAAKHPKPMFQRSEGTYRSGKLHDEAPDQRRRMDPQRSGPAESKYRAECDEADKEKMKEGDDVGEQDISHVFTNADPGEDLEADRSIGFGRPRHTGLTGACRLWSLS